MNAELTLISIKIEKLNFDMKQFECQTIKSFEQLCDVFYLVLEKLTQLGEINGIETGRDSTH
jgi:hypothetical protein